MTDKTTATAVELKEDTVNLGKIIKGTVKIEVSENDPSMGLAIFEPDTYSKNLPEDISVETIEKLQRHDSLFASASNLAFGEACIDFAKKHPKIERISGTIPTVGKDNFELDFRRQAEYPKLNGAPGEKTVKHAVVTIGHNTYSTRPVGELKKVKTYLADLGAKALAK